MMAITLVALAFAPETAHVDLREERPDDVEEASPAVTRT